MVSLRDIAPILDRDWPESGEKQVSFNLNLCNDGNRQNNEDPSLANKEIEQPASDVNSDKVTQSPSRSLSYMKKLISNHIPLAKTNLYCRYVLIALVYHLTDWHTIMAVLGGVNDLICAQTKVTHFAG